MFSDAGWPEPDPDVTFFFGYGEGSRAHSFSGVIGCFADVQSSMLGESVNYDQRSGVCHLIEMKDNVLCGLNRLLIMEPADLGLWHAGHTSMKPGHLPMRHGAACYWVEESGLLANRRFLYTGEAGGDMPLRIRSVDSLFLP